MRTPAELLSLVTRQQAHPEFGQPFTRAFAHFFEKEEASEEVLTTAICCSLFLSSIKQGFPREKLHTYIYNVREDYQLLIFDCKSYEPLHAIMQQELVLLLDENMRYQETEVSKNDIFEAFDFITNR